MIGLKKKKKKKVVQELYNNHYSFKKMHVRI
jgi:hypothetical protein